MEIFESIAWSPIAVGVAIATIAVAVFREIALASQNEQARRLARFLLVPFLVLLAGFVVVAAARIITVLA